VEKAALQERAREVKAARSERGKVAGEADLLAKIAEMEPSDRMLAERLHALIMASAPVLEPRTWYGQPAYARDGKVVCFFQAATKFEARYCTLGFNDAATLDDGTMWPTAYALTEIDEATETAITDLVKRAVSQA